MADLVTAGDVLAIDQTIGEERAAAMLKLIMAKVFVAAPCLRSITDQDTIDAVKAIVVPAVVRWAAVPAGMDVDQHAGPFSSTAKTPGLLLWQSELTELQALCGMQQATGGASRARFPRARRYPDPVEVC